MLLTMKNLKDQRTNIFPSTTRGGKELPSSSALDSPSGLSKLATPTHAIVCDRSHVIDDATFALHDTYDETTSMLVGPRCHERVGQKMSCKFFSISTYDYIWNICLHYIDELELVLCHPML